MKSFAVQGRVVGALLMREVITRFGRNNLGVFWVFLEPMILVVGVTILWNVYHHGNIPSGISITAFAWTGYSTVMLWRQATIRCGKAIEPNLGLLFHRNVKVLDLFFSRIILEVAGGTISTILIGVALVYCELIPLPKDTLLMVCSWLLLMWYTFGTQADFLALGHPFIDAMLRRVGDYSFGGHNAVRVISANGLGSAAPKAGYQFNFTVRSRVQREDGDEYLFDMQTVVVLPDGTIDAELSSLAASRYSENESPSPQIERALDSLDKTDVEEAFQYAKAHVERTVQLWDWDEDVELIGVARVVTRPAS